MPKILFLSPVSCSAVTPPTDVAVKAQTASEFIRRSDLPIYPEKPAHEDGSFERTTNPVVLDAVKNFRQEACKVTQTFNSFITRCEKFIDTGIAHSYGSYMNAADFLREEKNVFPRIGVITGGALFGYILNFRKGIFKRSFYTITGATIVASICYPSEAKVYFHKTIESYRQYVVIGYHFVNGVTKDVVGFELPVFSFKPKSSDVQESPTNETKTT